MIWDTEQYLMFDGERTQPAVDLLLKSGAIDPKNIIDIGCGPGNSTGILCTCFPDAEVMGIDSSPEMIEKARENCPKAYFTICDAGKDLHQFGKSFDLVFSNACIQWIPDHEVLIPNMLDLLHEPGGILAVQVPMSGEASLYKIVSRVVADPRWGFENVAMEDDEILLPEQYYDILSKYTKTFSIWETTYYHRMSSRHDLIEWVKGTRLRPYLEALDDIQKDSFLNEIYRQVEPEYPIQNNREIVFKFKRLFFTAQFT